MAVETAGVLGLLLVLGWWERRRRDRAHHAIPIRIHVNGTRGKSTVTRLIAAALREAGIITIAKTTGTAARLILPDGTEQPIRRLAPANIREQLWLLRAGQRHHVQALVAECMAIDPGLQQVSERDMLKASMGVITNARLDHGDLMGDTPADVAAALAQTVPRGGVLVLSEPSPGGVIEHAAEVAGTRLVYAEHSDEADQAWMVPEWLRQDMVLARAATRELAVADEVALRGMARAAADLGAARTGMVHVARRSVTYLDASAANDPESLGVLLGRRHGSHLFVFNHRADRPYRLRQFASVAPWSYAGDEVIVTGDRTDWLTLKMLRRHLDVSRLSVEPPNRLAAALAARIAANKTLKHIVFCGNTRHFNLRAVVAALEAR